MIKQTKSATMITTNQPQIKRCNTSTLPSSSSSATAAAAATTSICSSSSSSAAGVGAATAASITSRTNCSIRPNTLNVLRRDGQNAETKLFIGEALNAWRAKARCNVVPAERLQELFHELRFNPSEKQITEMLQTAKKFARKGSRQLNGLTFGEFCVLAADLKRFRTCNFSSNIPLKGLSSLQDNSRLDLDSNLPSNSSLDNGSNNLKTKLITKSILNRKKPDNKISSSSSSNSPSKINTNSVAASTSVSNIAKSTVTAATTTQPTTEQNGPEVFLGGSCNPTTWRADVAIPTLDNLGISFYNPQVSDWTPDLIELEYRAKEKARVLFFVIDSETRASAGAIEVAYIAGQNARQLVLVLHSYRQDQSIFNEPISPQEFNDLSRNQKLLRELVTRRGLPVLDNIPQGLQRTKQILAGIRDPPSNIASILIVVRGAFDRVATASTSTQASSSLDDEITLQQCQRALSFLGYAQSLLSLENLKSIIQSHKESLESCTNISSSVTTLDKPTASSLARSKSTNTSNNLTSAHKNKEIIRINFDEFCVLAAYLSVLQQEIHDSGCTSPIKGTNLPPPPIFLANMQEGLHNTENAIQISSSFSKQIFRTSSCTSVPDDRQLNHHDIYRNRDSGTSSPQPIIQEVTGTESSSTKTKFSSIHKGKRSKISMNVELILNGETTGEESDSNDSVFSSGSSINSNFADSLSGLEFRDVYLGGSCYLRTKWRQDIVIPLLNSKGISYHLPALHESILPSQLNLSDAVVENTIVEKKNSNSRLRRKDRKNTQELDNNGSCNSSSNSSSSSSNDNNAGLSSSGGDEIEVDDESTWPLAIASNLYNPSLLDSSRVLLFVITNETRSLAPMTLAAHCIGLMYNVVLCVQMLPEHCMIDNEKLTPAAIKDYNRARSYLIDLAKRQGVPVFHDLKSALECTIVKVKASNSRNLV